MTAPTDRPALRGAILAGGAASRFGGRPKGLEKVGGERILDRLIALMRQVVASPPVLIANHPAAHTWTDLAVVPDVFPERGSLGGLYTAVTVGELPVLVLAWDMPFIGAQLLQAIVGGVDGYDAFLPEGGQAGRVEPFCGIYAPTCAQAMRRKLDAEDLRATSFHDDIQLGVLPRAQVERFGDPEVLFFNVNTPNDLLRANELVRQMR